MTSSCGNGKKKRAPATEGVARRAHPGLEFDEGSMTALDLADGALGGIVAVYSVIHIPKERLPEVFAEFHRVLAPGGQVLLAFQVGDEPLHLTEAFGDAISLDFHRRLPDRIAELLSQAGLVIRARLPRPLWFLCRYAAPAQADRPTRTTYLPVPRPSASSW